MTDLGLIIDSEKCIHCGLCIKDCGAKALQMDENNIPKVALGGENRCYKCQHCLAICPVGALSILNKKPENSDPINNKLNPDELLNLIKSRRSVRHYKHENVSKDTMDKLKDMLKYVPTGCNNHGLHFSIIADVEIMDKLREKTSKKLIDAICNKTVKAVAGKFGHYLKMLENGEDVIFRTAPHMIVVSVPKNAPCKEIDPTIALSYFELYANSMGIGTCWCGLAYACFNLMPELLGGFNIPDTHRLGYVMLFGYPEMKYSRTVQSQNSPIAIVNDVYDLKLSFYEKMKRRFQALK